MLLHRQKFFLSDGHHKFYRLIFSLPDKKILKKRRTIRSYTLLCSSFKERDSVRLSGRNNRIVIGNFRVIRILGLRNVVMKSFLHDTLHIPLHRLIAFQSADIFFPISFATAVERTRASVLG